MDAVAVIACLLALVACAAAGLVMVRLRAIQRNFRVLWGGAQEGPDVANVIRAEHDRITSLDQRVTALSARIDGVTDHVAAGLRHVSVVRYDAFGDMGGRLSFSAAIVDDRGDGLVISSIHARGESRTYAKGVIDGGSELTLTPEERQALAAARTDREDA
ncbi:DUF4446 family protein [Calidifontibacter sp. DB0510]|uniref:DUF4446 family protein n=1 Tax=Metallococcus carri TaxID=1656884 RepID=A0A967EA96_9MICO|nr:DUF4446 family protein [Metallococcus carri]NHN57227.1 DUF4446 family protein [Metallococcus carri]NOP37970.1 DUF4446 family protein [Calidifontibacter sp. DB2511S]